MPVLYWRGAREVPSEERGCRQARKKKSCKAYARTAPRDRPQGRPGALAQQTAVTSPGDSLPNPLKHLGHNPLDLGIAHLPIALDPPVKLRPLDQDFPAGEPVMWQRV